jgi:hypothetical protein
LGFLISLRVTGKSEIRIPQSQIEIRPCSRAGFCLITVKKPRRYEKRLGFLMTKPLGLEFQF